MTITDFLEEERGKYIKAFNLVKEKVKTRYTEVFIEVLDDNNAENSFFPSFRYDIFPKVDNESFVDIVVNNNPTFFDIPQKFTYLNLEITVYSFAWNGCVIKFFSEDFKPLNVMPWYAKNIQIYEEEMNVEFKSVIHSIVFNENSITIDFGSINVGEILKLFEIFTFSKTTHIEISSSYS
jgi:hypothetical protein